MENKLGSVTVYNVTLFFKNGMNLPFRADQTEMRLIRNHLRRPKFLQSKAFQITSDAGDLALLNMREVSIVVMKELYEEPTDSR